MIFLALKSLWRAKLIVSLLIMNLTLGFAGFVAIESFKSSLQNQIQKNSKNFLSADLAVTARRQITEEEQKILGGIFSEQATRSETYDFFAMLNVRGLSRLVLVKAIDDVFPLYGEIELQDGRIFNSTTPKTELLDKGLIISPEIQAEFDLKPGDGVGLGKLDLKLTGVIERDTSQTFRAAGLAPKIFVHRNLLAESGLLQFGSTFTHGILYRFNNFPLQPHLEKEQIEAFKAKVFEKISDPAVRVESPESAGEDSGRQLSYLSDFLGLVALVSLFLSVLGAIYLIRLDLKRRSKEFAIFRALGMSPKQFSLYYFTSFAAIGLLVCLPTALLSGAIVQVVGELIRDLGTFDLDVRFEMRALWVAFALSLFGTLLICLPQISMVQRIKASGLFSEGQVQQKFYGGAWFLYFPLVLLFLGLSFYQAKSFFIAGLFVVTLLFSFLALGGVGYLILFKALPQVLPHVWYLKYPMKGLIRRRAASLALFVSLGLGALLLNILPQLKTSLMSEFEVDGVSKVPSLFLFDIQEDQIEGLKEIAVERKVDFLNISPMIRSRILAVNGTPFERQVREGEYLTREEEAEVRFRNRGANLTIREKLSDSETLVDGEPFSSPLFDPEKSEWVELSVEQRYADRLGLKLGDIVDFDVQGVEIKGKIVNLRKVKWTSFQPNFFIVVQPGAIEEAPKTFIAALPQMDRDLRVEIQKEVVQAFPNISVIDVERLVKEILKIADQMSWSLQFMSALSLLLGYTILFSMILSQLTERRWEINLVKVLGSNPSSLRKYLSSEYLLLSLVAGSVGSILSLLVSFSLSHFVFENIYVFDLFWPVLTVILIVCLTLILTWFLTRKILREKPLALLRGE